MDPLSITTAVAGLLKTVAEIVITLKNFIDKAKDTPHQAQIILQESSDFQTILSQLQNFLLHRTHENRLRSGHILIEQVVLTLTGSVLTFSELQEVLDQLKIEGDQGLLDRVKWMRKEGLIERILKRMQSHKASIGCMLNIITVESIHEVHESVTNLTSLVSEVLASNSNLARRMESLENLAPPQQALDRVSTTIGNSHLQRPKSRRSSISSLARERFGFAFDPDLKTSRVYRRISFSNSHTTLPSISAPSASWSILSGLSLSQISNISIITLPLTQSELFNAEQYDPIPEKDSIYAVVKIGVRAGGIWRPEKSTAVADFIDYKAGELLSLVAVSDDGWVVVREKAVGRLWMWRTYKPGMLPISDLEVRMKPTGAVFRNSLKAVRDAGIENVRDREALKGVLWRESPVQPQYIEKQYVGGIYA